MILCKRLPLFSTPNWIDVGHSHKNPLFFLHSVSLTNRCFSSANFVSYDKEKQQNQYSSVVSYLINSCGLSPECATTVSKKVTFETLEKPDSVLALLRRHGLTITHIAKLIKKHPHVLGVNVEKTLLPKLEFFHSVGISGADLADILSSNPSILSRSLKNQIIPSYSFLKELLCHNAKVVATLKRGTFLHDVQKNFAPNIAALRAIGVQRSSISMLITSNPSVLCENPEKFDQNVDKVVSMGFSPSTTAFVNALVTVCTTNKLWEQKMETYRSWGWSEEDFWLAFRKYPRCMTLSIENINVKMDLFVNKMGWEPSAVASASGVLAYSLEKRIMPRWSVIRVLLSNGLMKYKIRLSTMLMTADKYFIDNYVTKYEKQVPNLLKIFQGNVRLSDLGSGFEQNAAKQL